MEPLSIFQKIERKKRNRVRFLPKILNIYFEKKTGFDSKNYY